MLKRLFGQRQPALEILERNGVRVMHLGGSAIQSAQRLSTPDHLELHYTRAMLAGLLFVESPRDLLLVGLGGGSLARYAHARLAPMRVTAIEIDPRVVAAARGWFGLPENDERLTVVTADGLAYLRDHPDSTDLLLMDAFENRQIPLHLRTSHTWEVACAALRPGGVFTQNFMSGDERLEEARRALSATFPSGVLLLPSGDRANLILLGVNSPARRWPVNLLEERARRLEQAQGLGFPGLLRDLLSHNLTRDGFLLGG